MKKFIAILMLVGLILVVAGCLSNGREPNNIDKEGSGFESAIVIQADSEKEGIGKEYEYLGAYACLENGGINRLEMQELRKYGGHTFDLMHMLCNNGETEVYYFRIDSFFGKM